MSMSQSSSALHVALLAGLSSVAAVFALSDTIRLPDALNGHDKALHVVAFFVISITLMWRARARMVAVHALLLVGAAISLEWAQPLLTLTREASVGDVLASAAGIGAAALCAALASAARSGLTRRAAAHSRR